MTGSGAVARDELQQSASLPARSRIAHQAAVPRVPHACSTRATFRSNRVRGLVSSLRLAALPSAAVQRRRLKRSGPAAEALADGGPARVIGSGTEPLGASWRPTRCARGVL